MTMGTQEWNRSGSSEELPLAADLSQLTDHPRRHQQREEDTQTTRPAPSHFLPPDRGFFYSE